MSFNGEHINSAIDLIFDHQKSKQMSTMGDKGESLASERKLLVSEEVKAPTPIEALHAAAESWMLTRVGFQLLRCIGEGYKCVTKLVALYCYGLLIMPGLVQVVYNYLSSSNIRQSIVYGDQPRNRLDLIGTSLMSISHEKCQLGKWRLNIRCTVYRLPM